MPRYIDADALIADFESVGGEFDVDGIKYIINTYHKPADAVPVVRGEWKNVYKSGHKPNPENVCSECDCWSHRRSNFCPNCGADMRRKSEVHNG